MKLNFAKILRNIELKFTFYADEECIGTVFLLYNEKSECFALLFAAPLNKTVFECERVSINAFLCF